MTPEQTGPAIRNVANTRLEDVRAQVAALPCVSIEYSLLAGGCFTGELPPGVNNRDEYNLACIKLRNAGFFDKPGCPDVDAGLRQLEPVPPCLDAGGLEVVDYCGPDAGNTTGRNPFYNALCWMGQLAPRYYDELSTTPPCPGQSQQTDQTPIHTFRSGTAPGAETPTDVLPGMGPTTDELPGMGPTTDASPPPPPPPPPNYWLIGGIAAAALGGLYLITRK